MFDTLFNRLRLHISGVLLGLSALVTGMPGVAFSSPTLDDIQADPAAYFEQIVMITGTVTLLTDANEFILDDGTGQIVVDAGPPWYQLIDVPVNETVTVTGQIDFGGRRQTVDLDACEIVTSEGTVSIRDCSFIGPPPWAGGPGRGGNNDDDAGGRGRGGPPPWAGRRD